MVCRIRRYKGLSSCFGVKDTTVAYMPFLLKFRFKHITDDTGTATYLVVQSIPLFSAFKSKCLNLLYYFCDIQQFFYSKFHTLKKNITCEKTLVKLRYVIEENCWTNFIQNREESIQLSVDLTRNYHSIILLINYSLRATTSWIARSLMHLVEASPIAY